MKLNFKKKEKQMKIEDYGRIINLWGEVTPEMSLYVVMLAYK